MRDYLVQTVYKRSVEVESLRLLITKITLSRKIGNLIVFVQRTIRVVLETTLCCLRLEKDYLGN